MRLLEKRPQVNPLTEAVRELPPGARRAMYAAANRGLLSRGSWNGCAFNRAGSEIGRPVWSVAQAARVLGTQETTVRRFIRRWDRLRGSNASCTQLLREALEEAGLFEPPASPASPTGPRLVDCAN